MSAAAKTVLLLPGDGVGVEVTAQARRVVDALAGVDDAPRIRWREGLIGGAAIDAAGDPFPDQTARAAEEADAILLGAVGAPQYDDLPPRRRPERGLLAIRERLRLFANLRPAVCRPALAAASPLRPEIVSGLDILIVRELIGGIYFGEPRGIDTRERDGETARRGFNTMAYDEFEARRIGKVAFAAARARKKRLCSVDKANVLEAGIVWREAISSLAAEYPDVELSHMYVDNAAMQLALAPTQFDVIVAGNLFGDILSDETAALVGSIGMLPSASLAADGKGLFEPVHGSAPDLAGRDVANPLAAILSAAMMMRHSLAAPRAALRIERAVDAVLASGARAADLARGNDAVVGCARMGELVAAQVAA